jgi:hypothetical protein
MQKQNLIPSLQTKHPCNILHTLTWNLQLDVHSPWRSPWIQFKGDSVSSNVFLSSIHGYLYVYMINMCMCANVHTVLYIS